MMSTEEEAKQQLKAMRAASDLFYMCAQKTNVHAFLEFTGLMNKYIGLCEREVNRGNYDFAYTNNRHGGKGFIVESRDTDYLAEKFDCIFGASLQGEAKKWFIEAMGWEERNESR